jgi:CheY-like chemotaxis protein
MPDLSALRILVVDDDADTRELVKIALRQHWCAPVRGEFVGRGSGGRALRAPMC